MTEIIAERIVHVAGKNDSEKKPLKLTVQFHKPHEVAGSHGSDWKCDLVIREETGKKMKRHASGVDGVQALSLAMFLAGTLLTVFYKRHPNAENLEDSGYSDHETYGFPATPI